MDAATFFETTARRAEIDEPADAIDISRAVLITLAERLEGSAPDHLAARLPEEVAELLPGQGAGKSYDENAFVERVIELEEASVEPDEARTHIRAVFMTLIDAAGEDAARDAFSQLPEELVALAR